MDPLSQAVLGSVASQSVRNKTSLIRVGTIGALAGMAPDLDVLIQSATDPLLSLEYHRQFTHSLIFIPLGAALCALAFLALRPSSHELPAGLARRARGLRHSRFARRLHDLRHDVTLAVL